MLHAWYCNHVPCSMAETFTVPRREPNMVILLNGHSIEWLYKSVAYITRKLSDLIREKFFVFVCALDDSIISVLSPKRLHHPTPFPRSGTFQEDCKSQRLGTVEWNSVFWARWDHRTSELTGAVDACTRPSQGQAIHYSSMEEEWLHETPLLMMDY